MDNNLQEALRRFTLAADSSEKNRSDMLDDLRFLSLDQWPQGIKRARENDPNGARPCLVLDQCNQYLNQIVNDMRKNRPSLKVRPVDSMADKETAKVFSGIIRHIEQRSSAEIAYLTAGYYAAAVGLGYFRILTEWEHQGFNQEIKFAAIHNPFSVYFDPFSSSLDGSDAEWAFITDRLSKDAFQRQWPSARTAALPDATGDHGGWFDLDAVRIAEYFYLEHSQERLLLLDDGSTAWGDQYEDAMREGVATARVVQERKAERSRCRWMKHTGAEILDSKEFPSSFIPIIPSYGNQYWLDTERRIFGAVRPAKDPQRAYNYHESNAIEIHALAPRAPYIGAVGQTEGLGWDTANTENKSILSYNPITAAGSIIGAPQRQPFPGVQAGTAMLLQLSAADIQAAFGQYNVSIGAPSNEKSGIAIREKKIEGETNNYHYIYNLSKSIEHAGYILLDMIPRVYGARESMRILGEDSEAQSVRLDPSMQAASAKIPGGEIFNLGVGRYDLEVSVGPGYASRRQESVESILELARSDPKIMQVADDLIVRALDLPGGDEIAERLKKTIPSEVRGEEEGVAQPQDNMPQAREIIEGLQSQLAQSQEQLQEASEVMELRREELRLKRFEAKTRRLELQMKMPEAQARAAEADARASAEEARVGQPQAVSDVLVSLAQAQSIIMQTLDSMANAASAMQRPKKIDIIRDAGGRVTGAAVH